jgi:outer membrane protein, heavy metal efflux system
MTAKTCVSVIGHSPRGEFPMRALLCLATLLLAGCAKYEARPLSPERFAADFDARTLDDPNLKAFLQANLKGEGGQWDFNSLTLVALFYHPSLDVARAQWAVVQAGIKTAGERPNPSLDVGPQYTTNAESGVSPWIATIVVSPIIETAGKRGLRIEQGQHMSESARLNLAAQAWQVRSALRTGLLDHAAAQSRVSLLQRAAQTQQQIVKLLDDRLAAGAIAAPEVTAARVAFIKTQADLVEAQRQAVESRTRVAEALGLPLKAIEGRTLAFDLSAADSGRELESAEVRQRALHSRADILALLAEYAASQSALQLEIARQYPDIRLGPGYEYDQGSRKWGLGIGVDLPVLNHNEGPIAEAEAKRAEVAARFLELQARVIAEIDRAMAVRMAVRDQLQQIDSLLGVQRRQALSVEEMVKAGAADQYELRSAQLELQLTELTRLDTQVKAQQSLGQLEDAVQMPFDALRTVDKNPRKEAVKETKT